MVASRYQQNTARTVKEAAQIVDIIGECVALKRAGVNLKGLCPFHAEKTPSFIVSPERQTFHCFGCGEGGDVFNFIMLYYRLSFPEALKQLAERYHIQLPETNFSKGDTARSKTRQKLFYINEKAATVYHKFLLQDPSAEKARVYLIDRGITKEITKQYMLGYAPDQWDFLIKKSLQYSIKVQDMDEAGLVIKKDRGGYYDRFRNRILFPIHDLTGKVSGFGGRILGQGEPKYLNSPETPIYNKSRTLFGLYHHRDNIRQTKRAVLVEGNFDLISLAMHGISYVAAPLGTAVTAAQIRILKGYADEVILLFDGDSAGLKAALRAVPIFLAEQVHARVAVLPSGHDPDTYIREYGKERLEEFLEKSLPLPEFVFDRLVEMHGTSLEGKGRILKEIQPIIQAIENNPLQRSVLVSQFSERLDLDPKQVLEGFEAVTRQNSRLKKPGNIEKKDVSGNNFALPRQQRQLLEFLILHPTYLERFIEAGIEDVLVDPFASTIIDNLKGLFAAEKNIGPEMLLDVLTEGPERSFVSKLLISSQVHTDADQESMDEQMAAEQLNWIKRARLEKELEGLTLEITQACNDKNEALQLELSLKKIALNRALKSADKGDRD